ncbi:MAG: T9SS type A sorting domain-containing protein [Ignavibacteria bacterium]
MKKRIIYFAILLVFVLIPLRSYSWDTTAAKFYPLNVGNVYIYEETSLWFNCDPFEFRNFHKVIINDIVLKPNGKMYYQFTGWWNPSGFSPSWNYQRVDSTTMNIYAYDETNNSEYLIDSLKINSGNSFSGNRFNSQIPVGHCNGFLILNIMGEMRNTMLLNSAIFSSITAGYGIAEGIGFTGYSSCEIGSGTSYHLKGCILNGELFGDTSLTKITQTSTKIPDHYSLSQNYPNPFNPMTIINYQCSMYNDVSLKVFDVLGNEVSTLVNEKQTAGSYSVTFDGSNFPSGVYFYKLEAGQFVETKRMVLIK